MADRKKPTPAALWRKAERDRDRYRVLLREHGYIYERDDAATVHTAENPKESS